MTIPSKVNGLPGGDQIKDAFSKLNLTIDNIVTGLTYNNNSNVISLSKLNGNVLSTTINKSYGFSDYQFYSGGNTTIELILNYGGIAGYFWKRDSFLHLGQGGHNFYLPNSFTENKGYKLTFLRNTTTSYDFNIYLTENGINTESNIILYFETGVSLLNLTVIWTGTSWIYYNNALNNGTNSNGYQRTTLKDT